MRGLSGSRWGPPATASSRSDPARTGMALSASSAVGTRQLGDDRLEVRRGTALKEG